MRPLFLFRLFLDSLAVGLLLAALAYDWLGNAAHEVIGTVLFLLLIAHGSFNRRWYGTIAKGWREPRRAVAKTITLSLLMTMLALVVTSVIISQAVFSFLPLTSTPTSRQIHASVAYLVLLAVGAHLGLHGSMIMGLVRRWSGVTGNSKLRSLVLRTTAVGIAAYGIHSLHVMNVEAVHADDLGILGLRDFDASLLPASRRHRGTVCAAFVLPRQVASQGIAELRCETRNVS